MSFNYLKKKQLIYMQNITPVLNNNISISTYIIALLISFNIQSNY